MDILIFWDKLGTLLATVIGVCIVGIWRKASHIDKKFTELELDMAKNYATKNEFKQLDEKIDHLSELINGKIDNMNTNILLLLRTKESK